MTQKRAMVFIDAQNLIHAADDHYGEPKQLDFIKLVDVLTEGLDLIRPYFSTPIGPTTTLRVGIISSKGRLDFG